MKEHRVPHRPHRRKVNSRPAGPGHGTVHGPRPHHGPRRGPHVDHGRHRGSGPRPVDRPVAPAFVAGSQTQDACGTLELNEQGDGFLRDPLRNYAVLLEDVRVPADTIRRLALRGGEHLEGAVQSDSNGGPARRLVEVQRVNDGDPASYGELKPFEELTVVDPRETIRFETVGGPLTMRVVDLLTPIGRGQRGLIVAPPRTGKTILLTQMAAGIRANHPDVRLMMLLIDERPEEVTDMRRTIGAGTGPDAPEVVYSSNDKDVLSHVRLARLMIAKAKRQVERGKHVFILLDSLTRLGRAFNHFVGSSGRTMSGGIDIRALTEPKAMFGAARKIEHGGSITIIASALIDTGSRMDEFIFQEFKGTGNMELVLSRELANLRIWPAMDIAQSGTRKEELLLTPDALPKVYRLRRRLLTMKPAQQMEQLLKDMTPFKSNGEFLAALRE
jgi:transcription termination factor Rho